MNTEVKEKGRFSWIIPVIEVIIAIAYLWIGYSGIIDAAKDFDFDGMFKSVKVAIWFLVIATAVVTILCFLPIFKSKGNIKIAIWNIIWMIFTIYGLC